jgi:hypothetical protein
MAIPLRRLLSLAVIFNIILPLVEAAKQDTPQGHEEAAGTYSARSLQQLLTRVNP